LGLFRLNTSVLFTFFQFDWLPFRLHEKSRVHFQMFAQE
jgi:hypothetical protein